MPGLQLVNIVFKALIWYLDISKEECNFYNVFTKSSSGSENGPAISEDTFSFGVGNSLLHRKSSSLGGGCEETRD